MSLVLSALGFGYLQTWNFVKMVLHTPVNSIIVTRTGIVARLAMIAIVCMKRRRRDSRMIEEGGRNFASEVALVVEGGQCQRGCAVELITR